MNNSHVSSPKGSVKRCLFSQEKEELDASVGTYTDNSFLSEEKTSDGDASFQPCGNSSPSEYEEEDSDNRDYVNNNSISKRVNNDELDSGYEEVDPGQLDCDFNDVDYHDDSRHNEEMNSSEGAFSDDFHTDEYDNQPVVDKESGEGRRQMTINECKPYAAKKPHEWGNMNFVVPITN